MGSPMGEDSDVGGSVVRKGEESVTCTVVEVFLWRFGCLAKVYGAEVDGNSGSVDGLDMEGVCALLVFEPESSLVVG